MVKIIRNDGELVIRDLPLMKWIAILAFAVLVGMTLYYLTAFIFSAETEALFWLLTLFFLAAFGYMVYLFLTTPVITTTINRQRRTLTIRCNSLLKNDLQTYRFDELAGELQLINKSHDNEKHASIEVALKSGETIEIVSPRTTFRFKYADLVDEANGYLVDRRNTARKPDDFKLTIFNDD